MITIHTSNPVWTEPGVRLPAQVVANQQVPDDSWALGADDIRVTKLHKITPHCVSEIKAAIAKLEASRRATACGA